jgi:hypothetical protein
VTETNPSLTEFLLARLSEEEAVAKAVLPLGPIYDHFGDTAVESAAELAYSEGAQRPVVDLFLRFADPARVLADVEAKRRIVERCSAVDYAMPSTHLAHGILAELALPYASHPDYREAWRP